MKVSTSTKTVIKEIAPLYDISPIAAAFLLKFDPNNSDNHDDGTLAGKMCDKLFESGFLTLDFDSWNRGDCPYMLTESGTRFTTAVKARKETRVMFKHGCDLFPELANINF